MSEKLSFSAFAENVGMSSCTVEGDDAYLGVLLVEQQPVWRHMALPIILVVTRQKVILLVGRQRLVITKKHDDF